ncbi:MAG: DUF669 domain-containing protein [Pseudomonadota bacterium]
MSSSRVAHSNLVPPGWYPARLVSVEEAQTRRGDSSWKLRFVIEEGDQEGRSVYDTVFFTPAAMKRAKCLLSALGMDEGTDLNEAPFEMEGRRCMISLSIKGYVDGEGQQKHRRNAIGFFGFRPAASAQPAAGNNDAFDDVVFDDGSAGDGLSTTTTALARVGRDDVPF